MAFNATAHATALTAEHPPFEFEWRGTIYRVPAARTLPTGGVRQFAVAATGEGGGIEMLDRLGRVWPQEAVAALMEMPITTATAVAEAWLGGVEEDTSGKSASLSPVVPISGTP